MAGNSRRTTKNKEYPKKLMDLAPPQRDSVSKPLPYGLLSFWPVPRCPGGTREAQHDKPKTHRNSGTLPRPKGLRRESAVTQATRMN